MKKNFFKKLSFVMALAMVLSTLAPAASAFSATAPSINVAKKYLYLNEEGKISEYDFNIKDKVAGSTYAWASDNEAVAEVDAATGLTVAKAVGTAHITVTITFKDGTTKDLKATVVVRDNIETIDVSNVPTTDVAVNKEYDFNRSFVTFNGSTTKTSSISRWTVDKTTATIAADSGKFTATQAGEYQVTVNAFQSAAQYDAWLVSKDATLVKATKTVKVTVSASVVSTVQVDPDTFKVTFDSDMSKTDLSKTTAVLYQVISGKNVSTGTEKIKELKLDATGTVATVDLYAAVSAGTVYNFVYGKLTGTFTAAKKDIANIAGLVVDDFNVSVGGSGEDFIKHVKAVDANGVVIYDGNVDSAAISGYMSYSYGTSDTTKGNVAGGKVFIYSTGYAATVSATFTNYVYDATAKAYKAVTFTDSAVATGITAGAITVSSLQFGLGSATSVAGDFDSDSEWKGNLTVPAGESAKIWTRFYTNTSTSTYVYTPQPTTYTYTSADTNKLLITGTSLYPISSGTVTVIVKDSAKDNAVVATFDVVIVGGRTFASATQDVGTLTIGNNTAKYETAKATVTLADSLGSAVAPASVSETYSFVNKPSGAADLNVVFTELTGDNAGKVEVSVNTLGNASCLAGYYNLKVTFDAFNVKKDVYFTVIVVEANTAATTTVANWAIDLSDLDVDKKANFAENVEVSVYGYNAAGMRVAQLLFGTDYTLDVTNGSNTSVASGSSTIVVVTSGAPVTAWDNGTYTVTVNLTTAGVNSYFPGSGRANGSFLAAKAFTVSDTTSKSFSIENATVAPGTVLAVVQNAFNYKINGNDATEANISSVTYSVGAGAVTLTGTPALTGTSITSGQNIYVEKVTIQLIDAGRTINVEIPVGVTIAVR